MIECLKKEVKLSDGRVVVMRELTGLDEIQMDKILAGDKQATSSTMALGLAMARLATLYSIVSIDGKEVGAIHNMTEATKLAMEFRKRDLDKLAKVFQELNGDPDDSPESDAAATN